MTGTQSDATLECNRTGYLHAFGRIRLSTRSIRAAVVSDRTPLLDLCQQLERVQAEAEALGLFVGDRDLLDCPNCKLFEDVTAEGLLITSRELATPPIDTGLRFSQISSNTFQCPACGEVINLHEGSHGEE